MTKKKPKPELRNTPAPAVDAARKRARVRRDPEDGKLDEELVETFPASDPPSTTPTVGPGSPKT